MHEIEDLALAIEAAERDVQEVTEKEYGNEVLGAVNLTAAAGVLKGLTQAWKIVTGAEWVETGSVQGVVR